MGEKNARTIAIAGLVGTAVLATFLLMPAMRWLGWPDEGLMSAAIMIVPTVAVLVATSLGHYGLWRSVGVAVAIMVVTTLALWVLAIFTLAAALAGSPAGMILGIALYASPAVLVLVLGALALRFVPPKPTAAEQREHATSERP